MIVVLRIMKELLLSSNYFSSVPYLIGCQLGAMFLLCLSFILWIYALYKSNPFVILVYSKYTVFFSMKFITYQKK